MQKKEKQNEKRVPKDFVNVKKAAEILHRRPHTLDQDRCENKGAPYYRIRGSIFYSESELEEYKASCRVVPENKIEEKE